MVGQQVKGHKPGSVIGRRRRVLIIIENLPAPFDRRVWQEATALVRAGYEVSIVCPRTRDYPAAFEVIDGIEIHRHPLPFEARRVGGFAIEYLITFFWECVLAWRIFLTRGFDVVHACNPPDTIFLVALPFKLLFGRRFVFDHHDINPELYEAKFGRRDFWYRLLVRLERWSHGIADLSIATNESYRRIAIERAGVRPDRVFVVRSGPSLERMRQLAPVPALRLGRRFLVAYVGVMGEQEGIQYLLEAARQIAFEMKRTDVVFRLVGDGTDRPRLEQLAREMGLSEVVTFTGRVSDMELLEVLNTAHVCVNPDEYNEMNDKSTMNKIMEYMALGKPIVQFDLTEGRFTARDASLYARRNDAADFARKIVELLDDPDRRERMGEFGRRRVVEELSWDHEAPKLLAAYASLWQH